MLTKQQITKFIFTTNNSLKVQDFLRQNPNVDPRQHRDRKQNNVLHNLSFNSQKQLIELYINHTVRYLQNKKLNSAQIRDEIASWLNLKNHQGYTPILYAAFNGDVQLIRYLQERGSDFKAKNNTNLNSLHLAAQNNKVSTIIYFHDKLNCNQADINGSTPLHWAAFNASEQVTAYLLTFQDININAKNSDGQTPLFLATVYGNTKIVRRLLMKGCKRYIKNKKGQTPLQKAKQNQFSNIIKMLDDHYTSCDLLKFYYNVKVEYNLKARSYKIPIVFFITAICCILIINALLIFKKDFIYIIQASVLGIMFLFYCSLLIPQNKVQKQNINQFLIDSRKLCFQCIKKIPKRGYHCDICRMCIEQYDHHCTWINNCVGKHNIGRFIIFLLFLLVSLAFIGATSLIGLLKSLAPEIIPQTSVWIDLRKHQNIQWRKWAKSILFFLNSIVSLFFIPVLMLFIVQVKNILTNKTTYQSVRSQSADKRKRSNINNQNGLINNCKAMCLNNENRQSISTQQSADQQLLSH